MFTAKIPTFDMLAITIVLINAKVGIFSLSYAVTIVLFDIYFMTGQLQVNRIKKKRMVKYQLSNLMHSLTTFTRKCCGQYTLFSACYTPLCVSRTA